MKVLKAYADWEPRRDYTPAKTELSQRRAISGNLIWKNPSIGIVDETEPKAKADELVVKVRYCGICGSDTHVTEQDSEGYIIFSGPARFPCTLGHEYSGEVVEVGKGVTGFRKGDLVTGESILWCGKCLPCRYGMLNQCENIELLGLTADGAFAEYISVDAKYCWKLNNLDERFTADDVLKVGALIEPLGCAYNGIFISGGGVHPGSYVVVYGAGPIGLGAILLLKAAGAAMIIALDVVDERLDIARKAGADHVFNLRNISGIEEKILTITDGWGADLQVEAAGAARRTIPLIQRLCSKRGRIIYLGRAEAKAEIELNSIVSGAHYLVGSRGHSGYGIFPDIIRLLRGGKLDKTLDIITTVSDFSEIGSAFDAAKRRVDGKILIKMTEG